MLSFFSVSAVIGDDGNDFLSWFTRLTMPTELDVYGCFSVIFKISWQVLMHLAS